MLGLCLYVVEYIAGGGSFRCKKIDESQISNFCARVSEKFKGFIADGFFYKCVRAYTVDSADWALYDVIFIF